MLCRFAPNICHMLRFGILEEYGRNVLTVRVKSERVHNRILLKVKENSQENTCDGALFTKL